MEGEEGGVGDASLSAGDTCGGVEESSEELRGAASSESPEERSNTDIDFINKPWPVVENVQHGEWKKFVKDTQLKSSL